MGFIFGFVAGYFNTTIKMGASSGAAGIAFSFILFGVLSPLGFLVFYSLFYVGVVIIPSITCGTIGGAIGSRIRKRSDTGKHSRSPKMTEKIV